MRRALLHHLELDAGLGQSSPSGVHRLGAFGPQGAPPPVSTTIPMARLDKVRRELDAVHRELENLDELRRSEPFTTEQIERYEMLRGYEQLLLTSVQNT